MLVIESKYSSYVEVRNCRLPIRDFFSNEWEIR